MRLKTLSELRLVKLDTFTVTKIKLGGINKVEWNVDHNGIPFGKVWTWTRKGETHPYHVVKASDEGSYRTFDTYKAAEAYLRGLV